MADGEPGFLNPFDVAPPDGAEGWERLYPYYIALLRGPA